MSEEKDYQIRRYYSVLDSEAQTAPTFKSTELFTRIISKEVRNRLFYGFLLMLKIKFA